MKRMRLFKIGSVTIKSGTRKGYLLTERPNTETGSVTQNIHNYVDMDGAEYSDIFFAPRTFEIKGAILFDNTAEKLALKRKLIAECNPKAKINLSYFNGREYYCAPAIAMALPEFGEEMNGVLPFMISICLPGFYWLSANEIKNNIYKRTNTLKSPFILPMVFSERINQARINNNGEVATYPIFNITCNEDIGATGITIKNNTTQKHITIDYAAEQGETITVNHEEATVTSSTNGNIIKYVTADSDFFTLEPGLNEIESMIPGATVTSLHRCRYLGV